MGSLLGNGMISYSVQLYSFLVAMQNTTHVPICMTKYIFFFQIFNGYRILKQKKKIEIQLNVCFRTEDVEERTSDCGSDGGVWFEETHASAKERNVLLLQQIDS